MKHKTLMMALGLSLIFNVFVLLGFVQSRARTVAPPSTQQHQPQQRPPAPAFNQMARELNLNERQRSLLGTLQDETRRQGTVIDQSLALVRQSLREEVRKENPDVERIRELVNEESEIFRQRRLAEAGTFSRFMDELSPEQRRMMRKRMGQGPRADHPPIPRAILERFDHDGNGLLDADELRQARQEMDRRRRELNRGQFSPTGD